MQEINLLKAGQKKKLINIVVENALWFVVLVVNFFVLEDIIRDG